MNTLEQQFDSEVITQLQPSPNLFFETMQAYQRTAALKAAIELDLFTAIGETTGTLTELVRRLQASERGVRVLCDYLVVMGFLHKNLDELEFRYGLTSDSAAFLDKRSPKYVGSSTTFWPHLSLPMPFEILPQSCVPVHLFQIVRVLNRNFRSGLILRAAWGRSCTPSPNKSQSFWATWSMQKYLMSPQDMGCSG